MSVAKPIPYNLGVESPHPEEQKTIESIIQTMTAQAQTAAKRQGGHIVRASHGKSTALLVGKLEIPQLPQPLAQGLFATPGTYDCAIRFAQGPGEILSDKVSTHRGMAVKILGVPGQKLPEHLGGDVQDFVFATGPTFPSGTAAGFARDGKVLQMATPLPEVVKSGVSSVARGLSAASEALTGAPSPLMGFYGHPFIHPLADSYYTQAPVRYGEYVAKLAAFPADPVVSEKFQDVKSESMEDDNIFRNLMTEHFSRLDYSFDIKAQLRTNEDTMPVEDASVEWKQSESPYVTIATLKIPSQDSYSTARQQYFDENMNFGPAHSLEMHRPLGSVMRARMKVYGALSEFRHRKNGAPTLVPEKASDIPA